LKNGTDVFFGIVSIALIVVLLMFAYKAEAGELTHQFHSPAFSGNGYSTHVLTIDQLETQRKQKIKDDEQAAIDKAEREEKATNIYKFKNNLESRIYAQLSKQIADALFGEDSGLADTSWQEVESPFGDTIKWKRENDIVYVEIYDSNGNLASEFQTPVGDFAF
jgi:hypothetical protein